MASSTASPPLNPDRTGQRAGNLTRILVPIAVVAIAILCAFLFFLSRNWPFSQSAVLQDLREDSDSQVQVRAFHETFFPSPGCTIEGLVFHHRPNEAQPLITIERLIIQGSYSGLLTKRVSRVTAEGLHVVVPPFGSGEALHTTPSKITVSEIVANGAVIEFASKNPGDPRLRFIVHEALFNDVSWNGPLTYKVKIRNPEPPGDITATGKFGVWNESAPGETPLSGEYTFQDADLSVYEGIAGRLSSSGKFSGKLGHIDITGTTETPDFEVKSGRHPVKLQTNFTAFVDAIHGDTFLQKVESSFSKTQIVWSGSVADAPGEKGKSALMDLQANNARIDDILRLFVSENRPPMSGSITMRGHAELPPGDESFLEKVKVRGSFGIVGNFSTPSTQQGVNKLSAGARGEKDTEDPETVISDLKGSVNLRGGTATFTDLSFGVPGASARMHGTFNLLNHKIDLRGQLQVETKISNTESGPKAFMLKMMQPFFKKKKSGEIVPVRISGTYDHPTFGLDLNDKKAQNVPDPSSSLSNPARSKPYLSKTVPSRPVPSKQAP